MKKSSNSEIIINLLKPQVKYKKSKGNVLFGGVFMAKIARVEPELKKDLEKVLKR
ncbi:MAG TPA: hypothetical protein VJZ92_02120 [Thermodesulfobacteriota bacterium]|nr:hypothetical protein [Thermodesulfobacteriota bacterium]